MNQQTIWYNMGYIALDEQDAERKATKLNRLLQSDSYCNGFFLKAEPTNYIGNHGILVHSNVFETEEELKEKIFSVLAFNF